MFTSIFFILGFSAVFVTFGATATAFGQAFRQALPILTPIAGLFIIAMGLHFLGVFRIGFLDRQLRHNGPGAASGPVGGFLLGLAFASRLDAVHRARCWRRSCRSRRVQDTAWQGAGLLGVYSLGLGVPFLLAGIAIGPFLTFFSTFRKHLGIVEKDHGRAADPDRAAVPHRPVHPAELLVPRNLPDPAKLRLTHLTVAAEKPAVCGGLSRKIEPAIHAPPRCLRAGHGDIRMAQSATLADEMMHDQVRGFG